MFGMYSGYRTLYIQEWYKLQLLNTQWHGWGPSEIQKFHSGDLPFVVTAKCSTSQQVSMGAKVFSRWWKCLWRSPVPTLAPFLSAALGIEPTMTEGKLHLGGFKRPRCGISLWPPRPSNQGPKKPVRSNRISRQNTLEIGFYSFNTGF